MTFKIKELSVLKQEFNKEIGVLLKRNGVAKIEDLSDPRKYEVQYLTTILGRLETQVSEKTISSAFAETVFYGAMYTIIQDIENNRGVLESPGLLSDSLKEIMRINPDVPVQDQPDIYQVAKLYTALNAFLNQVFVKNDSREGLQKHHFLQAVPTDKLKELIKTSYELSRQAEKAIVESLVANGKTTIVFEKTTTPVPVVEEKKEDSVAPIIEAPKTIFIGEFKQSRKSPLSAVGRFESWEKLSSELDELISDERADKNISKINKLDSKKRAAQLHYLNELRAAVQKTEIDELEKIAVLAGGMHLVRKQIANEYSDGVVAKIATNKDNSVIHKGLDKILGKRRDVDPQDIESLIFSVTHFMRFMTIEPKADNKKAIRSQHIFSEIVGFDLKSIFNLCIDMIHSCRNDALTHVIEESLKEGKTPEKPSKSYFSSALSALTFYGSKKEDPSEDEDDEFQHKSSASLEH